MSKKKDHEQAQNEISKTLYENTTPLGPKASSSMPKVKFQKTISTKQKNNFSVFNRYLQFKFGKVATEASPPILPVKRKNNTYNSTNLYDLLKLDPGCDKTAIKKSYRKLVTVHHPDKGGDPFHFRCLNQVYEILTNDHIREVYDNTGLKEIKNVSEIDTSELEEYILSKSSF